MSYFITYIRVLYGFGEEKISYENLINNIIINK